MIFKHKRQRIGLLAVVISLLAIGVIILHFRPSNAVAPRQYHLEAYSFSNQNTDLQKFEQEIRSYGGKAAYNRLAAAVADLSADDQHEYGHLFGDALYKVEGLKGIAVCDTRFSYGCFHQVLSDAMLSYGPSAVPMLNQKCKEVLGNAYLSCQHGLGHGIMVSVGLDKKGYSEANLKKALAECAGLPDDMPLGGCDGGVYMEYNLHTVANVELEQNDIRHPDPTDLDYPCDKLQHTQRSACYFWMPQWWALAGALRYTSSPDQSDDQVYKSTGDLCAALSTDLRRSCFEGIGYAVISTAKLNPKRTLELCEQSSIDKTDRLHCRSFAASMLMSVTNDSASAMAMCRGLTGSELDFCKGYANQKGNFFAALPDPVSKL